MKRRDEWTQSDSDKLGHFIDVAGVISRSSWRQTKPKVGLSIPSETVLPTHEAFVFVAVYFRQLFCDGLLVQAKNIYCKFSDSAADTTVVTSEFRSAEAAWNGTPLVVTVALNVLNVPNPPSTPTTRELFETFMYGAHVLHSRSQENDEHTKRLRELIASYHPHVLLGLLNGGLIELDNHISAMARVIYPAFQQWFNEENLPPPDVYWQNQLFNTPQQAKAERPGTSTLKPVDQ